MKTEKYIAAADLGGSSGKMQLFGWNGHALQAAQSLSFANAPIYQDGQMLVDTVSLFASILDGLERFSAIGFDSFGIDTWGGSYSYIKDNKPVGRVFNCRDMRTGQIYSELAKKTDGYKIFRETGVSFKRFTILAQLCQDLRDGRLCENDGISFLPLPNLFAFLLTGTACCDASTALDTCLTTPCGMQWNSRLISSFGLPSQAFNPIAAVGTPNGSASVDNGRSHFLVVNVAGHDTVNAVASIPDLTEEDCFVSIGTTIVVGAPTAAPVLTRMAYENNFKNAVGVFGQNYLCTDITGFWVVNECIKQLKEQGEKADFETLQRLAESANSTGSLLDLSKDCFKKPSDRMLDTVYEYCQTSRQKTPSTTGETIRCILESFAAHIRLACLALQSITGKNFRNIYIVSGGVRNTLLMRLIAEALKRDVCAGIPNATLMGNALIQLVACKEISTRQEMSDAAANSVQFIRYTAERINIKE